jgi:hexosaminidase
VPSGRRLVTALLLGAVTVAGGHPDKAPPSVIPLPARMERGTGAFTLTTATPVAVSHPADPDLAFLATYAADVVREAIGRTAPISAIPATRTTRGAIALILDPAADALRSVPPPPWEAYYLEAHRGGITVTATSTAGLFYGVQTLRQLIPHDGPTGRRTVPAVTVSDRPRFRYRGMHLDVVRHVFPVPFIKRYIDLLARYKLNTFHWHLTDDQGWRIEIRKYPRLTQVGAWRRETVKEKNFDPYVGDGIPYGGFYTQDQVRDVVEYARRRHVTVIPEIEMPGHAQAALAAYPELACTAGPFEVRTLWGVDEDVYCPTERTFAFLEDVLTEVLALFPSPYVHIGGDEVPKIRWKESPDAQAVMRREGLKDEHELQSWFIRRIERFLKSRGRRLIGWDEILEGGLAPEATVMSWRGTAGGIAAAQQGHDAIMTPGSHLYFDYYQGDPAFEPLAIGGFTPLDKVYAYEPVPDTLTPEQARHILGAQANVWTEYLKTPEQVEYMALPRMLALAEVVWSPREARDWTDFARRLPAALAALDRTGVNYRPPHVEGLETDRLTLADRFVVTLRTIRPDAVIRYTTDGTAPDSASPRYTDPMSLRASSEGVTVTARAFLPNGRASAARAATFRHASPRPPLAHIAGFAPGLAWSYHELPAGVAGLAALDSLPAARVGVTERVALRGDERAEWFGYVLTGFLQVPEDAVYTFTLTSDDGSSLEIGDRVVIDHDGYHGAEDRSGQAALAAGWHAIRVRYFQATGGKALALRMAGPTGAGEEVPAGRVSHRP